MSRLATFTARCWHAAFDTDKFHRLLADSTGNTVQLEHVDVGKDAIMLVDHPSGANRSVLLKGKPGGPYCHYQRVTFTQPNRSKSKKRASYAISEFERDLFVTLHVRIAIRSNGSNDRILIPRLYSQFVEECNEAFRAKAEHPDAPWTHQTFDHPKTVRKLVGLLHKHLIQPSWREITVIRNDGTDALPSDVLSDITFKS
jgi:hypothetical protein